MLCLTIFVQYRDSDVKCRNVQIYNVKILPSFFISATNDIFFYIFDVILHLMRSYKIRL